MSLFYTLLIDSVSYLDHVNGKKHQKALNFSMRVERVGVDAVRNRLELVKRKMDESKTHVKLSAEEEYNSRIAIQITEDENRKKKKKEEIIAKKIEAEQAELETMDPELAAIMGFNGFGAKKR
jgi:U4/U6.U5 tri-snRNP component SNU23